MTEAARERIEIQETKFQDAKKKKKELLKIKHPAQSWQENTESHGGKNGANSTETNKRKQDKQKEVDPTKMGKP